MAHLARIARRCAKNEGRLILASPVLPSVPLDACLYARTAHILPMFRSSLLLRSTTSRPQTHPTGAQQHSTFISGGGQPLQGESRRREPINQLLAQSFRVRLWYGSADLRPIGSGLSLASSAGSHLTSLLTRFACVTRANALHTTGRTACQRANRGAAITKERRRARSTSGAFRTRQTAMRAGSSDGADTSRVTSHV